jgi:TP901 family phage tail tape measure protein
MAEEADIRINIDTTAATASIKNLQRQISEFHTSMARGSAEASASASTLQQKLLNNLNASGKFSASIQNIRTTTESFTNALEKNKLSMGEYFRFAGGASKTFGRLFKSEFDTINKVARENVKTLQTQYIKLGRDASGAMQAIKVRPLALDMQDLGTKTQIAAQKQAILNQLLRQGSTNLLNFGKNTQWAGRQLMVGFTIPLSIMGSVAVKEFQKIEQQVVKFRRVYGGMFNTTAETDKALKKVRELANEFTKYGIAVEKTIDLAAKVAQMGNVGKALEEQVTQATRLSVLGGMEQMEALDTTISMTNAFGVEIQDLASKINFLNAAENQTILAIEDFNTAVPLSGSVVKQLGGSVEDLAFLLTAMREGGISAAQAGNALKSSLGRLIAPSRNAKETLGGFGIDVLSIVDENAGNLMGTVMTLGRELDRLDPLSRARSIEALFGKFQFARMSTLFQNITREGSQANKVLELTAATSQELAIIANRELRAVEESSAFKLQKQMEELKASLAPIGEAFAKAVIPLLEFGTKVLKQFDTMSESSKTFLIGLVSVVGLIGPVLLMTFGLIANGVANVIKLFTSLKIAYNSIGSQSLILGEQSQYMTNEQLEAASVAASLEQAHTRLTQAFTVEAGALQSLTSAYRTATAAQANYLMGVRGQGGRPNVGPPPAYLAEGILSVPGSGNKDTVPAMLTPGEAVIPKDKAKKYSALVKAIISGNIPGFSGGTDSVPRKTVSAGASSYLIETTASAKGMQQRVQNMGPEAEQILSKVFDGLSGTITMKVKEFERRVRDAYAELSTPVPSGVVKARPPRADAMAAGERRSIPEQVSQEYGKEAGAIVIDAANAESEAVRAVMEKGGASAKRVAKLSEIARSHLFDLDKTAATKEDWSLRGQTSLESNAINIGTIQSMAPQSNQPNRGEGIRAQLTRELSETGASVDEINEIMARIVSGATLTSSQWDAVMPALKSMSDKLESGELSPSSIGATENFPLNLKAGIAGYDARQAAIEKARVESPAAYADLMAKKSEDEAKLSTIQAAEYAKRGMSPEEIANKTAADQARVSSETTAALEQSGESLANTAVEGLNKGFQNSSPSKKMNEGGQDGAQGAIDGLNSKQDDMRAAGEKLGDQAVSGASAQGPVISDQIPAAPDERIKKSDFYKQMLARQVEGGSSPEAIQATENFIKKIESAEKRQGMVPVPPTVQIDDKSATRLSSKLGTGIKSGLKDTFSKLPFNKNKGAGAVAQGAGISENIADVVVNDEGEILTNPTTGLPMSSSEADKLSKKMQKKQAKQRFAGKLSGLAMTATIGAGVVAGMAPEGSPIKAVAGEFAMIAGTLSAVGPLLAMLPGPLGIIIAAVGLIGYGIFRWNEAINKAREEGRALGNALSVSADRLIEWSEVTGKVTATEKRRQARQEQLEGTQEGQRNFGQNFLQSDSGQALINDIKTLTAQGLSLRDSSAAIGRNLAIAVTQGVFTAKQANGIASAIGTELNDYSFAANVSAKITELLGPDGRKLKDGKLSVAIEIQQESRRFLENIKSSLGSLPSPADPSVAYNDWDNLSMATPTADTGIDPEKFRAAISQIQINTMSMYQQNIDMLEDDYSTRLLALEAEKKSSKSAEEREKIEGRITDLASERELGLRKLEQDRARGYEMIMEGRGSDATSIKAFNDAIMKNALARFSDDDPFKIVAENTMKKLEKLPDLLSGGTKGDEDFKTTLQIGAASGDISLTTVEGLLELKENPDVNVDLLVSQIIKTRGSSKFSQVFDLLDKAGVEGKEISTQLTYFANIKTEEDFDNKVNALAAIANFKQRYDIEVAVTSSGIERVTKFKQDTDDMPKVINKSFLTKYLEDKKDIDPETSKYLSYMLNNWDVLSQGKNSVEYEVMVNYVVGGDSDALVDAYLIENGLFPTGGSPDRLAGRRDALRNQYRGAALADRVGKGVNKDDDGEKKKGSQGGSGAAKIDTTLDSIAKKLRDIRKNQIKITEGWDASAKALNKLFGGKNQLKVFSGLENDMRALGASEDLIQLIAGMPPEEFEKQKDKLFTFDKKGNITGFKKTLNSIAKALQEIALGDFVNEQEKAIKNAGNQAAAFNKLAAAGMSVSDALAAVTNEAFAAAVATAKIGTKKWERIVKLAKEAAAATKAYANETAILQRIEERNNEIRAKAGLASSKFSYAEQQAILSDKDLTEMFLAGNIGTNFRSRMSQILSPEFLQGLFEDGMNKALEAIEVKERRIELDFQINTKYLTDVEDGIISIAQREIAALDYILDDLNAGLKEIQDQEEDINAEYDKRTKALDKVRSINDKLARQQKNQISLAEALSSGDIAAAARATQELRAQQASDAVEQEKENMNLAREKRLSGLVSNNGKTRIQLEKEIKDIQNQIFRIEEDRLEPAQRALELAEDQRDIQISNVSYLGQTRDSWAEVAWGVDNAKTSSDNYAESVRNAIALVEDLKRAWQDAGNESVAQIGNIPIPSGSSLPAPQQKTPSGSNNVVPPPPTGITVADFKPQSGDANTVAQGKAMAEKDRANAIKVANNPAATNAQKAVAQAAIADAQERIRMANKAAASQVAAKPAPVLSGSALQAALRKAGGGMVPRFAGGGKVGYYPMGGLIPYKANGGLFQSINTDTVPAMLTPGEFVVKRFAVEKFGAENLKAINNGTYSNGSVYNYNLSVNVKSESDPDKIASAVMSQIKRVDSMRIRGNRF